MSSIKEKKTNCSNMKTVTASVALKVVIARIICHGEGRAQLADVVPTFSEEEVELSLCILRGWWWGQAKSRFKARTLSTSPLQRAACESEASVGQAW